MQSLPHRAAQPLQLNLFDLVGRSAWSSDNGKAGAASIAAVFNPAGYAVAGVSVRSSSHVKSSGQLYDVRAAIRWLRSHAGEHNLHPYRFVMMGNSSGGWLAAIAATTSDIGWLPGEPLVGWTSSAVQVAVPFFPPTDFLEMNAWYEANPGVPSFVNHDSPSSPESRLVGCAGGIQSCPDLTYVDGIEVPMLILHGDIDPLVPNGQSVLLYEALKEAGSTVVFMSVADAWHSVSGPPSSLGGPVLGSDEATAFASIWGLEWIAETPRPTWVEVEHFIDVVLGSVP